MDSGLNHLKILSEILDNMYLEVKTDDEIKRLEVLAREIWTEHYIPIIGEKQVSYMLEKFQSKKAIAEQLKNNYYYYFIEENNKTVGYIGVQIRKAELFLSKIYVRLSERGNGYAKNAINFIEKFAKDNNLDRIKLTVNKRNLTTIKIYEKTGFRITESIVQDIGEGFVMDDYVMEKIL